MAALALSFVRWNLLSSPTFVGPANYVQLLTHDMPLSGPAIAALAVFTFLASWNDFLWPLVITTSLEMRTLPVGLSAFQGQYNVQWHLLMAGSVIAMLPGLAIYVIGQKWIVRGITLTGMGGR